MPSRTRQATSTASWSRVNAAGRRSSCPARTSAARAPRRRAPPASRPRTPPGAPPTRAPARASPRRSLDVVGGDDQRGRDHQLDRARPRSHQVGTGATAASMLGEVQPRDGRVPRQGNGLEHRLGDERQRPLGADEQAAEDLERVVGVEEGAQPVAGRVLDLELAPDPVGELGVGADLVADLEQARGELGLQAGEIGLGARRRCRSPSPTPAQAAARARSSRNRATMPQRIPPELLAITPPTVAMSVDAGSGPSLRPCGARTRLACPSTVPGRTRARRRPPPPRRPTSAGGRRPGSRRSGPAR